MRICPYLFAQTRDLVHERDAEATDSSTREYSLYSRAAQHRRTGWIEIEVAMLF